MNTSRAAKPTPNTATSVRFFWWIRFNHASGVFMFRLPVARDSDLLTHIEQRAGRAFRPDAGANVFAERHQQRVDLDPVRRWQFLLERGHRLFRRRRVKVAPAVGHAVD